MRNEPEIGVGHIALTVSDVAASTRFYSMLGLQQCHAGGGIAILTAFLTAQGQNSSTGVMGPMAKAKLSPDVREDDPELGGSSRTRAW